MSGAPGISSRELSEWLAYERIEGPADGRRADYHAAQIVQTLIAINLKKGAKVPDLAKLAIDWDTTKPKGKSAYELLAKATAANATLGGTDERPKKL